MVSIIIYIFFFFFNDTATTEIYTLSLHDALPIWLDRVLHRQLLGDRLDEAVDDHRRGLVLGEAARAHVEQLVVGDAPDGCLVRDRHVRVLDLDIRPRVRARFAVHHQPVALHARFRARGVVAHL